MKPRQLKSGAWNVRIMVEGQSYSPNPKTAKIRMAAGFADEHRRRIENPTLSEALRDYIRDNEEGSVDYTKL